MAISWSQGLLAGAAGVAEYSEQEQKRRQTRIDKTTQLQNDMAMIQAKSKFAAKMNEYTQNKKQIKALQGVESGSYDEQFRLFSTLGYSPKAAATRAEQVMTTGEGRISRPTEMKEPTLNFKPSQSSRAKSPLQNWAEAYMKPAESYQPPSESLQKFIDEPQGELVPAGGRPTEVQEEPQVPEDQIEPQTIGGQSFTPEQNPYYEPIKPKMIEQSGSKGGKKGKWVVGVNEQTGEEMYKTFFANGETGTKLIDPKVEQLPDGRTVRSTRALTAQGKVYETGERWVTKQAKDPTTGKAKKIASLEQPTREQYIKIPKDDQMGGQFHTDFPKEEQEAWGKMEGSSFNLFSSNDAPENFKESMADAMLFVRNRMAAQVPPERIDDPEFMKALDTRAKALAYLKVLDVEGILSAVDEGAIEPDVFFGPALNKGMPRIKQIQDQILSMDDYKKDPSKYFNQFTKSVQF